MHPITFRAMSAAFDAQAAVRMDAEQLDQYMRELFSWSKEMKVKEASGKSRQQGQAAAAAATAAPHPPPVNPAGSGGSQRPSSAGTSSSREVRHPAAHTYEHYRAKWDRFDVDAALAEAEDDRAAAPSSGSNGGSSAPARPAGAAAPGNSHRASSAPVDIPAARVTVPVAPTGAAGVPAPGAAAPTSAEGWKDAGNAHFKAGAFQQAEACYSRSLELAPGCLAHANRAMARLKLGRLAEAEADCAAALALDPLYVKAYQRRAAARHRLGNLLGAVEDCEGVLRLEPNNKQAGADREQWAAELLAKEGLPAPSRFELLPLVVAAAPAVGTAATAAGPAGDALIKEVSSVPRQQHAAAAAAEQHGPLAAAAAAADGAAQVPAAASLPMATIQVMRSSSGGSGAGDEDDDAIPDLPAEAFELPLQTHLEHQAAQQIDGQPVQAEEQQQQQQQQATALPAQQALHQDEEQEQQPQQKAVVQQPGTAVQAIASPAAAPAMPATEQIAVPQLAAPPLVKPADAVAALSAVSSREPAARAAASAAPLKVPRTGVEFEKGWRGLRGDPQRQATYLLALPPAALPALLQQVLTPALLAAAAGTLLQHGLAQAPEPAIALLEALPSVPRFDLNLLSVPQRQRAELAQAWDGAAAQVAGGSSDITSLTARLAEARQRWKL